MQKYVQHKLDTYTLEVETNIQHASTQALEQA